MESAQQQHETLTGIKNPKRWTTSASSDVGAAPSAKATHYEPDPVYRDAEQQQEGSI